MIKCINQTNFKNPNNWAHEYCKQTHVHGFIKNHTNGGTHCTYKFSVNPCKLKFIMPLTLKVEQVFRIAINPKVKLPSTLNTQISIIEARRHELEKLV